jgi:hypothetical protein
LDGPGRDWPDIQSKTHFDTNGKLGRQPLGQMSRDTRMNPGALKWRISWSAGRIGSARGSRRSHRNPVTISRLQSAALDAGKPVVIDVEFRGWTPAGELRHPVFKGWHEGEP